MGHPRPKCFSPLKILNMELFYQPHFTAQDSLLHFDAVESKHLSKVLRKKNGDELQITNGKGLRAKGTIVEMATRSVAVRLNEVLEIPPLDYKLHVAIAPTKNISRFEWFLEKATEIGITEITPLLCDHSERKSIKHERAERIVLAALKQSQQSHLPTVHPMTSFSDFIKAYPTAWMAHCAVGEKTSLFEKAKGENDITVLIGPEGDFSPDEIKAAFTYISLGKQRLRTETAAIVACQTIALAL